MEKLTRRSILQSAPAVGLAALVPAAAVAEPQASPIMGMFREWQAKYEQACAPTLPYSEVDRVLDECRELERRMLAIPASSAGDFAAKLLAITSYGQYSLEDDAGGRFMAETLALAGVEAAPTLNT